MRLKTIALAAFALTASPISAWANAITFQGATFTLTELNPTELQLQIQIAAAGLSGDWSTAHFLDAFELKSIGSSITSSSLVSPGLGAGTNNNTHELNGSTCGAGGTPPNITCLNFPDISVAAGGSYVFDIQFNSGASLTLLNDPHLKIAFSATSGGRKVGSLFSDTIPVTTTTFSSVPGPVVGAGLPGLLAGFGAMLAWYRRRRAVAV